MGVCTERGSKNSIKHSCLDSGRLGWLWLCFCCCWQTSCSLPIICQFQGFVLCGLVQLQRYGGASSGTIRGNPRVHSGIQEVCMCCCLFWLFFELCCKAWIMMPWELEMMTNPCLCEGLTTAWLPESESLCMLVTAFLVPCCKDRWSKTQTLTLVVSCCKFQQRMERGRGARSWLWSTFADQLVLSRRIHCSSCMPKLWGVDSV